MAVCLFVLFCSVFCLFVFFCLFVLFCFLFVFLFVCLFCFVEEGGTPVT